MSAYCRTSDGFVLRLDFNKWLCFFADAQPESLKVPWRCFGNKTLNTCAVGLDPNKQAPMRSDCGELTEKACHRKYL